MRLAAAWSSAAALCAVESLLQFDAQADVIENQAAMGGEIVQEPVLLRGQHIAGRRGAAAAARPLASHRSARAG